MKLKKYASLGVTLQIEYEENKTYTKLQEFLPNDNFVVFQPTYKGYPLHINSQELADFVFVCGNGVISFKAKEVKAFERDNLELTQYEIVGELTRTQRRNSYRLPIRLGAIVRVITEDASETVMTQDISEGGMKFETYHEYQLEQKVLCQIILNKAEIVEFCGIIVRLDASKDVDDYPISLVSVKFEEVDRKQQGVIRKFIVKEQLMVRSGRGGRR